MRPPATGDQGNSFQKGRLLWLAFLNSANRWSKDRRGLRSIGTWAYSSLTRLYLFLPPPSILMNGPSKSGTHLLSSCLSLIPKMAFSGRHFALAEFVAPPNHPWDAFWSSAEPALHERKLRRYLAACPNGMFVTAHASYHPVLRDLLAELQMKHILLVRDPRDIVVSNASFIMRERWHHLHRYYAEVLKGDEGRIAATIQGFDRSESVDRPLASIGEIMASFTAWLDDPSTLWCRFEDLIGPRGGGDREKQLVEIQRIGEFVDRPLTLEQAEGIADRMYSKGSLTYRKGQLGDWRNHFTPEHRRLFKETAGEALLKLGYEESHAW